MKNKLKNAIKIIGFVGFGIFIFFIVYKDFDFTIFFSELKKFNYWWFIFAIIISIISHICRARRWQLLMETIGEKPRFTNTFLAVLNAYFANLAIPRLGEVTRCALISKYEKQDFSKVLGTVVSERFLDLLMVFVLTITAFVSQANIFKDFVANNPGIKENIQNIFSPLIIISICIFIILGFGLLFAIIKGKLNKFKICRKISKFIDNLWIGILSIKKAKHKVEIIIQSILIWVCYFFMLYFCFFAFSEFADLDILAAIVLFVAGCFGMIVPSPNGIGSYHFMQIQTLTIYGISNSSAATFALITHGLQTLIIIILGLLSVILIPTINKEK